MWNLLWISAIAYLLGSIPTAYLVTRAATGRDIRYAGDGNAGARNTLRVAGRGAGLAVLAVDVAKGAAAYWLARRWSEAEAAVYLAGLAVLVGHWLPVWLHGRGGIGQAAATGFLGAMWPGAMLAGLVAFGLGRLAWRNFDVAYGLGAAAYLAVSFWLGNTWPGGVFVVLLLVGTGAKYAVDRPRQRELLRHQAGGGSAPRRRR